MLVGRVWFDDASDVPPSRTSTSSSGAFMFLLYSSSCVDDDDMMMCVRVRESVDGHYETYVDLL